MTRIELIDHIKSGRNTSVKIVEHIGGSSRMRNLISGQLRNACKARVIYSLPKTIPVEYAVGARPREPKKEDKHFDLKMFRYDPSRPVTAYAV